MPASIISDVVLPQPDGTSTATKAPSSIARSTPATAGVAPTHSLRRFFSSTRAMVLPLDAADRHLRQIFLAEHVDEKTRQDVEHRDGRNDAVVDPHHVVGHPEQVQAHHPIRVLEQERPDKNEYFSDANK